MSASQSCAIAHGVGGAVAAVFAALAVLHGYWALGGTVGLGAAIPDRPSIDGDPQRGGAPVKAFRPSAALTLLVAAALAIVSALVAVRAGLVAPPRTPRSLPWCLAAIALVLMARAVGDLNLVGFFKHIRGSRFATLDTWVYSPLCLILALGIEWLAAFTPDCDALRFQSPGT